MCPVEMRVNMPLPWSVSVLLLSSVLGLPVDYNNTGNSTSSDDLTLKPYNISHNLSTTNRIAVSYCYLPTCSVHKLDEIVHKGDETADKKTQDPYGPGKK
ncbi:uncharacterized protein zgc:193726 [Tachysurus vachellii]|uniref:uncharacterized protein zgc:193726 n=1 Tax=Tachysurus vachellii TaxID=175792 RepID=UPI00296B0959|nr:uncharacterized protein zgc:193726 [Tachysurus vachellii]